MAPNTRTSNMLIGKSHPRTSKILSGTKPRDELIPKQRARSFFHDFAHIILPLAIFTHFIITGTVILVYSIYFSQKLPRLFIIGASIGFGVLLLLLVVVRVLLRHWHVRRILHDEQTDIPARKPNYGITEVSGDLTAAEDLISDSELSHVRRKSPQRCRSELSADNIEKNTEVREHEGHGIQIPVRCSSKDPPIYLNYSVSRPIGKRRNIGLTTIALESVEEVSGESSGSSKKSRKRDKNVPVLQRANPVSDQGSNEVEDSSQGMASPDSTASFPFEPSPNSQPAIRIINGDDDLNSNQTSDENENVSRAPTEYGSRFGTPDSQGLLGTPSSPPVPEPLVIRKFRVGNPPVHSSTYTGSVPVSRGPLTEYTGGGERLQGIGSSSAVPINTGVSANNLPRKVVAHRNQRATQVKVHPIGNEKTAGHSTFQTRRADQGGNSFGGRAGWWHENLSSIDPRTRTPIENISLRKRQGSEQSTQCSDPCTSEGSWISKTQMAPLRLLPPEEVERHKLAQRRNVSTASPESIRKMEVRGSRKNSDASVFSEMEARREMAVRDNQVRMMAEEVNRQENRDWKVEKAYVKGVRNMRESWGISDTSRGKIVIG